MSIGKTAFPGLQLNCRVLSSVQQMMSSDGRAAPLSRFGGAGERGSSNRSPNGPLLVLDGCWLSPVRDE